MSDPTPDEPPTAGRDYADRLERLSGARWKRVLNVQAPYRADLRRLKLGATLDIGCGTGRNLVSLPPGSVGVDHNPYSVEAARAQGAEAYTDGDFFADPELCAPGRFDSALVAHVVEHLTTEEAREIIGSYLPSVRPGGRFVFITPQERGYSTDATHVSFTDFAALETLANDLGLVVERQYSFPFPRAFGKSFTYNEFHLIARIPG
jgi:SAM-dependent methyltransferase